MTDTDFKETQHGRNHALMGADPIMIGLGPSAIMGQAVGAPFLTTGFGNFGGYAFIPDRDAIGLNSGDVVTISYAHAAPKDHFHYIAARIHLISGLAVDEYDYVEPNRSQPFRGVISSYALVDPYPRLGGYIGMVSVVAATNDDGETVTWTYPDAVTEAEQFSFDMTAAGSGHVGYSFHDFGAVRVPGDITASFSGSSTEREGATLWLEGTSITIGDTVGEEVFDDASGLTNHLDVTLTEDIPVGAQLLVVTAVKGPSGYDPNDQMGRPVVWSGTPSGHQVGKFRIGNQQYGLGQLLLGELNLTGTAGGGGAPSGSAGGALDGTYPNPGLASSVAGAGLAESSDVLSVNVDNTTIEISADTLQVKAGGIGATELASSGVTGATYGDATHVPQIAVDVDGRITAASDVAITASGHGSTVVDHGTTGATETIDVSAGDWHRLTLDANCTITVSGYSAGTGLDVVVKITQDGTGGRTITWDPDVTFIGADNQPTSTANSVTYFELWADAGDSAIYAAKVGGTVTESSLVLSDVTTDNVTSSAHGFAPKSLSDATKFLNGDTTPAYAQVKDSDLSTSDITTNNASTSKHGFLKKLSNVATQFMDGTGNWSAPSSGTGGEIVVSDTPAGSPLVFSDLLQNEAGTDLLYTG